MNKWTGTILAGAVAINLLLGSLAAAGNPYNSSIDQRQINQEQMIHQAWQSGQLAPGEYRRLQAQLQQIRNVENQMRRDRHLSPGEKATLSEMLDRNEADISRAMRHPHRRPGWHY